MPSYFQNSEIILAEVGLRGGSVVPTAINFSTTNSTVLLVTQQNGRILRSEIHQQHWLGHVHSASMRRAESTAAFAVIASRVQLPRIARFGFSRGFGPRIVALAYRRLREMLPESAPP